MKWLSRSFFFCIVLQLLLTTPAFPEDCGEAYVCREALVKFSRRLSAEDIRQIFREAEAEVLGYFPQTKLYHVLLSPRRATLVQIALLKGRPGVLVAAPNERLSAQDLPNDADFNLLWGLKNSGQTGGVPGADIGIEDVWDSLQDGSGVIVAILDSGIDYEHPDLAANIWVNPGEIPGNGVDDEGNGFIDDVHGYDFANGDGDPMDDNEHGTHVAGILGAVGNNGNGVTGTAWSAKLMAVKFLDEHANASAADAIPAIEYALANGAKILNNSWGGGSFNAGLLNAILEADAQGALFFAAAGNQGRNTDITPFFPAGYDAPNIISLASIDDEDDLSSFSNYGAVSVDLAAPGGEVYSTKPDNTYGYISGTSMSCPYAAGTAALLWTQFPNLEHRQIRNLILQGAVHRDYLKGKTAMEGLLNAANSFAVANDPDNQFPIANAGADQTLPLGTVVGLHGAATDGDGDFPLTFEWSLSVPAGSRTQLQSPWSQNPSFIPDREGAYTATLLVSDSLSTSVPDSVTVTIAGGSLPLPEVLIRALVQFEDGSIGNLASGSPAPLGSNITLDGTDSSSLFPVDLLFSWRLVAKPADSQMSFADSEKPLLKLFPDVPGVYTARLSVEDGYNENFGEISFAIQEPASPQDPVPPAPASPASEGLPAAGGCSLIRIKGPVTFQ